MKQATIRPNVKWSQVGEGEPGHASPAVVDALATALTLGAVSVLIGLIVLVEHTSPFWAGILLGGLGGVLGMIVLLGIGLCLAGTGVTDTPRPPRCAQEPRR